MWPLAHQKVFDQKGCKQPHPKDWVIPGKDCCHDFYNTGICKFGVSKCRYKHITLEDAQKAERAAAPAMSVTVDVATAASSRKATVVVKQKGRGPVHAPVASSAAAAAPSTPSRKSVQPSSLASLASPSSSLTRSHSTPSGSPSSSAKKSLSFGQGSQASSASTARRVDAGGFQQQQSRKKRSRGDRRDEDSEEEKAAAPPRQQPHATPAAAQQAISVCSDDESMKN